MDKLTRQLREDAARIEAKVSPELDNRIRASLHNVPQQSAARRIRPARSHAFWLASTLSGVAAALVLITVINLGPEEPVQELTADNAPQQITLPDLDLDVEAATLTGPLADELEKLQEDLRKAEEAVRKDVRIDL